MAETIFHRVIPNFMIQGGGLDAELKDKTEGQRDPIKNESDNGLTNDVGTVAMARTRVPDSATSQFFINVRANAFLNKEQAGDGVGYAVFGKVVEGMDVVKKIEAMPTGSRGGHQNVPLEAITINEAKIVEAAASPKLRGVCLPAHVEDDNHWLTRDSVVAGLREVARRGLSADVIVEPRQLPSVRALAAALPDLAIALAHIGAPFIARSEREPWGVHMLNLAPLRNVTVKLTGLVTLDTRPWNAAHLRLFVEPLVRMFGFDRMMFGSDWPAHGAVATYAQVIDAAREAAGPMTDAQHAQLFGHTAAAFYRLV